MTNNMTHAVCTECKAEFDYDLKPGFPRKYCNTCKDIKKKEYETRQGVVPDAKLSDEVPVVRPGESQNESKIKEPTGEYQSLVYNKTLAANSYEVGKSGNRFKLYFETTQELLKKIEELKSVGLMESDVDWKVEEALD